VQLSTLKYRATEDHVKLKRLNPKLETRNPKLETRNPKLRHVETVKSANRTSYLVNFFSLASDSEPIDPNSRSRNRPPEFQVIADFRDVEEQFL
jgi:hypothetical protein